MRFTYFSTALGALLLSSIPAKAVSLLPGAVVATTGTTVAANPALGGVVVNDNLIPFAIDPTPLVLINNVQGNVQNRVVRSNILNTLIFGPQIRDTQNIDVIRFHLTGFSLEGFGNFDTDVDFRTDSLLGDKGFTSVSRSADGNTLTFRYGDPLIISNLLGEPQEESLFPSILTDATNFALTGTMRIFGIDPETNDSFSTVIGGIAVPTNAAPVPEPATWATMIVGFGAIGFALRRRKARRTVQFAF